MAISFVSVKCPECNANLSIEEGRDSFFCTYCGAKVIINNENEHIIRNIDEARIKEAETDRMVKLRELELEKERLKSNRFYKAIWISIVILLLVAGIYGMIVDNFDLEIWGIALALVIGVYGCIAIFVKYLITNTRKNRQLKEQYKRMK